MRWLALCLALAMPAAADDLAGHGGPVMDIAVAGDTVLTASFDNALGVWTGDAPQWLEGHRAAVVSVAPAGDGMALSGSDDFDAHLWDLRAGTVAARFQGHAGKVAAARLSPDGARVATASWDGTARLWDRGGTPRETLSAHDGAVTDVAWLNDARLATASADGRILEWQGGAVRRVLAEHGFGVNVLATGAGWLAYGAVDGGTRVLDLATGATLADLTADRRPILALAVSPDDGLLAVGDGEGHIMVVETRDWTVVRDFRAMRNGPVWALAFRDQNTLLAGGIAPVVTAWPLDGTGRAPRDADQPFQTDAAAVPNGEAQFLRKCSVCHTLTADRGRRAGPPLGGVFGRPAGSVPDYPYSDTLSDSDIVWTETTIARLFEIGPDHYIPGSNMPMQVMARAADRDDLIAFLKSATETQP